ncbi:MAG: LytTR family DNA-binding domain-containing protein [Ruminococcus sp.]|jgi:DNA-binding LytR/AlgR family response regulator|nr:LytTR family DNA-binding domain-containing protein [Ruminococcus sp.]
MLNIAICDDNKNDLNNLKNHIESILDGKQIKSVVTCLLSAAPLLETIKTTSFDVVFLDIDIPEMSGFELASAITSADINTEIVFVTNHDEFVFKTHRYKPIGFIRKKYLSDEIGEIVEIVLAAINRKNAKLTISTAKGTKTLNLCDIIYAKSDSHYVDLFLINSKETIRESLDDFEEKNGHLGFIRVHNRYLVNFRFIYSIEKSEVILQNKTKIPISRKHYESVKDRYMEFSRTVK